MLIRLLHHPQARYIIRSIADDLPVYELSVATKEQNNPSLYALLAHYGKHIPMNQPITFDDWANRIRKHNPYYAVNRNDATAIRLIQYFGKANT